MNRGRLSLAALLAILLHTILASAALAGPDTETGQGKGGLDFNRGYDLNTVTTVSGRVAALPAPGSHDHAIIEIDMKGERVNLVVGPGQFWEKQGMAVGLGDEVTARGAMAQGRDGKAYMLTQKIELPATGHAVRLRSESGSPLWMDRQPSMMRDQSPGHDRPMHDRGGMMRGGERGMMRR